MKVEDYLHLYHGSDCLEEGNNKGKILGSAFFGHRLQVFTNCSSNDPYWANVDLIKPILRPLYSITNEEAIELMGVILGTSLELTVAYRGMGYGTIDDSCLCIKLEASADRRYNPILHFDEEDGSVILGSCDGNLVYDISIDRHNEVTYWLLKHSFGIFNLIGAGLAVQKK